MKRKAIKLITYVMFATVLFVGGASFAEDVTNESTGYNSVNNSSIVIGSDTEIKITNNAVIENKVNLDMNTGENIANGNTGDGSVSTGDIDASIKVENTINYCSINGDGDNIDNDDDTNTTTTTTTTTSAGSTTVITNQTSGGTTTVASTGTGTNVRTTPYHSRYTISYGTGDTTDEVLLANANTTDEEIADTDDLIGQEVKGSDVNTASIQDEKNCPWCIAIIIALAVLLGAYGFYLSKVKETKGIMGLWYFWPAILGYLGWVIHTVAHFGTGIGWFAAGFDKIIIAEVIIAYLAYYYIKVRYKNEIGKKLYG